MKPLDLDAIAAHLAQFAAVRDWDQFHTPKNLAMAVAAEAGELLEVFQWLTPEQSASTTPGSDLKRATEDEIADIFIYLIRLADVTDIDIAEALERKLNENEVRYPEEASRGHASKSTIALEDTP